MSASTSSTGQAKGRQALARSIGLTAFVYGYPLVESMRTCRLQTGGSASTPARAPVDALHHVTHPSTDRDRDIVTPANDLLYSTDWICLNDGPRLLTIPASKRHPNRYFVLPLYDPYTESFENLGPINCNPDGETVLLVGPGGEVPPALQGHRTGRCPTNLVWLIGRILVGDVDDLSAARALQSEIALAPAPGTAHGRRPTAVEQWVGEPLDAMAEAYEHLRPPEQVAPRFFTVLCQALADAPGRTEDQGLVAWLGQGGLTGSSHFAWDALDEPTREGVTAGFADAAALVASAARSRRARPWMLASRAGRYGSNYLVRALTAHIGLGALATDEALYGVAHFDANLQPLNGQHRFTLRFAADEMPPAEAFWSVTLYDAYRFFYRNGVDRHSIGDRAPGLQRDADGSLVITIAHSAPADTANWLPTPEGPFYLILRQYPPARGPTQSENSRTPAGGKLNEH